MLALCPSEAEVDSAIAAFPSSQILVTPHQLLWGNYCKLVKHSLVVVDSRYSEKFTDWEIWNQAAGSGLWSGPFELPWLWRAQNE